VRAHATHAEVMGGAHRRAMLTRTTPRCAHAGRHRLPGEEERRGEGACALSCDAERGTHGFPPPQTSAQHCASSGAAPPGASPAVPPLVATRCTCCGAACSSRAASSTGAERVAATNPMHRAAFGALITHGAFFLTRAVLLAPRTPGAGCAEGQGRRKGHLRRQGPELLWEKIDGLALGSAASGAVPRHAALRCGRARLCF
jgi:hypothetical protein